ncbi:HD domain-containing protein [Alkalihalobacillus pseudalcaliphilus]|uniref:HD domain-containing protein n=1 Tax=Alkalihalobacillus pseudalcaliphilus TaxID=79884 RepID=UPI003B5A5FD9
MNQVHILEETEKWVKEILLGESSGHDWYHIQRVTHLAQTIAKAEGGDRFIVTMAALLHDLIDDKLFENQEEALRRVSDKLMELEVHQDIQNHILTIIQTISYRGGNGDKLQSKEAMIVQDADRLDALGAIGIARTFAYSGHKGQPIYDPTIEKRENMTIEEYRNGKSSAIHHFYEKLLKLKDLMNTESGKKEANIRHEFMEQFLKQFYHEWK